MRLAAHDHEVDIAFPTDDHISRRIEEAGDFYERAMLEDCYERAADGLVIDAGAHIGNHTLWFAAVMGRDVAAFEPHRPSYDLLHANITRNGLWDRVSVHHAALGAADGFCRPAEPQMEGNSGSRGVVYGEGDVPVWTIDGLNLEPAVLKIDVEDSALAVLEGARYTLLRHRPLVYVESGLDAVLIENLMTDSGYQHMGWMGATPMHIYEAT